MTNRRLLACLLAGASAVAASSPAAAQRVDRIVAFGDSYADEGNAFELLGVDPLTTIIYPTGRFTGGVNYVDQLGQIYGVTPENFAIGGALTDNSNTNPFLPGFDTEVAAFQSGGGGVFPTTSSSFGPNDLLTVSIGGNDARVYASTPGANAVDAIDAAAIAVDSATANLDAIVGSDTPTISFLAGNTALLPEVAGNAPVQQIRDAYSTAFNADMQTTLAAYAANGSIVHYLDLTLMLQQVSANLEAYGFTNAGPCAPIAQCVSDANYASQFVFWVDALHPTSHTSQLIAQYIAAQLQAPLTLEAPSELGLDTARQWGRTLTNRMDYSAARFGSSAQGLNLFLVGDGFRRDVPISDSTDAFDIDGWGATAGVEYGFGPGVVGAAVNYSRPKAKFGKDVSDTDGHTWQVGAFGSYNFGGGFAEAYLGYGNDNIDINREGIVDDMRASPDASHWAAGAKAGYLMPFAGLQVGPVIGLDYAKAKVDGYTESGDPVLTLNVSSVSAKSLEGTAGLEVRGNAGASVRPFASAVLAKDFASNGRTVQFSQTSAPIIVNSWRVGEGSDGVYGRVSGGARVDLFNRITLDALVGGTLGRDDGNDLSVHVGLNVGL